MTQAAPAIGDEFALSARAMTRERMRWYVDAQATAVANDGRPHFGGPTIHDDDAYARKQGLSGIIADGMVSTNWIFALLVEAFGPAAAARGRLRTRYLRPVPEDMILHTRARVTAVAEGRVDLEVWCETPDGDKVTAGEAQVHIGGAA